MGSIKFRSNLAECFTMEFDDRYVDSCATHHFFHER